MNHIIRKLSNSRLYPFANIITLVLGLLFNFYAAKNCHVDVYANLVLFISFYQIAFVVLSGGCDSFIVKTFNRYKKNNNKIFTNYLFYKFFINILILPLLLILSLFLFSLNFTWLLCINILFLIISLMLSYRLILESMIKPKN